ncbi:Macrophage mannose receptor 1 like protein [Argiope bruennichi]|uniref:Macrophage mannose receptor 1 like protein n=1 Tax=Argiope bruennichi TaxID=94029 RepID=A0A8T0FTU9_ARGBR|nr:Macrophage mannose receptor 1 like protein [Argiope bruennichi]
MNKMHFLPFAVFFFVVSAGAFGCNPDWISYNGGCYKFEPRLSDVRMARKFCQLLKADLAFLDQNATTLIGVDPAQKYWIREDSVRTTDLASVPISQCPYLYQQNFEYGDCNEMYFFICEEIQEDPTHRCPEGWVLLDAKCYKAVDHQSNLTVSVAACHADQGQLAVLDDESKEANAQTVIIGKNTTFLVGAERENGTFKWFDGKPFNPYCSLCTNFTSNGNCLGIKSNSNHPTMFKWVNVECSAVNSFLCEREAISENMTSTPLPTTTSASSPPLLCPIGYNWKAFRNTNYCFWETTYETERLNWYQARQFCQAYGGDLATYRDSQEEDTGLGGAKGHYKGLWFGLKRGEDDIFSWVDGSELNYTNWDYAEPNLRSRSKYCASHAAGNARWELDYCGVRRWFICKAPKVRNPILPDTTFPKTQCNFSSSPFYHHRWYSHKNYCYLIHDEAKYSWDLAHNFCKDNEAHLASIHSFDETDFILFASNIVSSSDYWIGLASKGLGSSFTWSDGTPLDFLYWVNDSGPNETESMNTCISFDPLRGYWKTTHCNKLQGVICKRGINASYDFPTQEPAVILPGNCEHGWYPLGNKCYKVFGKKWTQKQSWTTAQKECEKENATLASIHNEDQQNFLTDLILEIDDDAWIGLENLYRGSLFQWVDDTALDYANWDVNEPSVSNDDEDSELFYTSSYERTCVEISYGRENMGKWNDVSCYQSNAYICQKFKDPNITTPSEDPFTCTDIPGWSRLVSFKNSAVAVFLAKRIKTKNEFFWTGIRETEEAKFGTFNGNKLKISNWLAEQPKLVSSFMDNCVAMNSQAKWVVRSCREKLNYVCEWNSDAENEIDIDESHLCPKSNGWQDIGGDMCIKKFFVRKTWNDAMYDCFQHGGSLVTFHSAKDLHQFVEHVNTNYRFTSVHIGLGRRKDGSYMWADYSPVDFTAWDPDDPPSTTKDCVELDMRTEKWRKVHCDDLRRNYFCSATKNRNIEEDVITSNFTKAEDIVSKKLAAGGIVGIVICLLVVLAIIGVTVYYVYPRERHGKLLVPESQL